MTFRMLSDSFNDLNACIDVKLYTELVVAKSLPRYAVKQHYWSLGY
jgi:hypothetical protein